MKEKGFSLIELMIVVGIIAILIGAALPLFTQMTDEAKIAKAKQDIDLLVNAISRFNSNESGYIKHLTELKGRYIVKLPVDPWGSDYYLNDLFGVIGSKGVDGKKETQDDLIIQYLPDPMLIDVKFHDVGKTRVCLPDENGIITFPKVENRIGPYTISNEGRAGPGDIVELTFSRPINFYAIDKSELQREVYHTDGTLLGEQEYSGEAFLLINDIIFTDAPVSEDDELFTHHLLHEADFATDSKHSDGLDFSAFMPSGQLDTILYALGDVSAYTPERGFHTIIAPGSMYINIRQDNHVNWAWKGILVAEGEAVLQLLPAPRPILLEKK